VKSVKTHLRRVVGGQILTFEELIIVLVQIEAVLNSRPLCPLSSDPNDLTALTPGHILTLAPLTCLPEPNLRHVKLNCLSLAAGAGTANTCTPYNSGPSGISLKQTCLGVL
jgi:hypothetical protein